MTTSELIERIKNSVDSNMGNRPPFTLIMGSGFSYPLIPTTSQIVREDLPWYLLCKSKQRGGPKLKDFADDAMKEKHEKKRKTLAEQLWKGVGSFDADKVKLGGDGLPTKECVPEAYMLALSAECHHGLCTPDDVRRYFAAMVARVGHRLNAAHLYLASLIADQPRLFGTLFTTNIDPLLQRAMQMMNVPYFVSDRPEAMQHPDDDEVTEALHLVYAHGSVYRYLLLNSPEQIKEYAERNQSLFQEYFRKHAVLIVGYSGWNDALTRALLSVGQFDHNLYWCDRGSKPEESGLSSFALGILNKYDNCFYVPIESADLLMWELHLALTGRSLPEFFHEPIATMKEQLRRCDLTGVKIARREAPERGDARASTRAGKANRQSKGLADPSEFGVGAGSTAGGDSLDLDAEVRRILNRLDEADRRFKGTTEEKTDAKSSLRAQVQERLMQATDLYFSKKYAEVIPHFDFILKHAEVLDGSEKALTHFRRGFAYSQRGEEGDLKREIDDYTAVIDMPDATAEQKAWAYYNRGVAYRQRGEEGAVKRAIDDYTAVIDMPDAPAEQKAKARVNRGVTYRQRGEEGDLKRAIDDYTAVLDMPDAPAELKAKAYYNRGVAYHQRGEEGDLKRAIEDYTAVIDMLDAPAEQRADARINRGITYGLRGEEGDVKREIDDCTAVIDMPDAPAEQRVDARINRGVAYGLRGEEGDVKREIDDCTAVIAMPDAPAERKERAKRLLDRIKAQQ